MSELGARIAAQIKVSGPISLAAYMEACLTHPQLGYYTTRDPLGQAGDFITAPEISQMFGEVIGLALAQYWLDLGSPAPFTLAELGPGRGTLMADVLRATRAVPGFHRAMRLYLLEASPALQACQRRALADHAVTWIDRLDALPQAPLFLIANEFFDALPIRQFQRIDTLWAETMVGLDPQGQLQLTRGRPQSIAALEHRMRDVPDGGIVEICPAAQPLLATISARLCQHGGMALMFDYGNWKGQGDTFQAVKSHGFTDPLAAAGTADLTAHVDFAALAGAASPAQIHYASQGALLLALGMGQRAQVLAQAAAAKGLDAEAPAQALHRLTHATEMGSLFKAMSLTAPEAPPPPGFETAMAAEASLLTDNDFVPKGPRKDA